MLVAFFSLMGANSCETTPDNIQGVDATAENGDQVYNRQSLDSAEARANESTAAQAYATRKNADTAAINASNNAKNQFEEEANKIEVERIKTASAERIEDKKWAGQRSVEAERQGGTLGKVTKILDTGGAEAVLENMFKDTSDAKARLKRETRLEEREQSRLDAQANAMERASNLEWAKFEAGLDPEAKDKMNSNLSARLSRQSRMANKFAADSQAAATAYTNLSTFVGTEGGIEDIKPPVGAKFTDSESRALQAAKADPTLGKLRGSDLQSALSARGSAFQQDAVKFQGLSQNIQGDLEDFRTRGEYMDSGELKEIMARSNEYDAALRTDAGRYQQAAREDFAALKANGTARSFCMSGGSLLVGSEACSQVKGGAIQESASEDAAYAEMKKALLSLLDPAKDANVKQALSTLEALNQKSAGGAFSPEDFDAYSAAIAQLKTWGATNLQAIKNLSPSEEADRLAKNYFVSQIEKRNAALAKLEGDLSADNIREAHKVGQASPIQKGTLALGVAAASTTTDTALTMDTDPADIIGTGDSLFGLALNQNQDFSNDGMQISSAARVAARGSSKTSLMSLLDQERFARQE